MTGPAEGRACTVSETSAFRGVPTRCSAPAAYVSTQNCVEAPPGTPPHDVFLCSRHELLLRERPDWNRCVDGHAIVVHRIAAIG